MKVFETPLITLDIISLSDVEHGSNELPVTPFSDEDGLVTVIFGE